VFTSNKNRAGSRGQQIRQSKAANTTGEYLLPKSPDFSLFLRNYSMALLEKRREGKEYVLIRKEMRLLLNA
jgi:hypothetical protein